MYDIILLNKEDEILRMAVNTITKGEAGIIPAPYDRYRVFRNKSKPKRMGDGGLNRDCVVIVGHASEDSLGNYKKWSDLQNSAPLVDWENVTTVYLVACSIAEDRDINFVCDRFAQEAKSSLTKATIWTSSQNIHAKKLIGMWKKS